MNFSTPCRKSFTAHKRKKRLLIIILSIMFLCSCHWKHTAHISPYTNVLLVSVRSLRADRLGCYGFKEAMTPHIDLLAKEGVLFSNAYTVSDMANPAAFSLLTSTYTKRHSPSLYAETSPKNLASLPKILKSQGYVTGGCAGSFLMDREVFPPAQDFDFYFSPGLTRKELKSPDLNLWAMTFLEKNRDKKWFLWLDYSDPAEPHEVSEKIGTNLSPYDQEVACLDNSFGTLIFMLEELKLKEKTLIIFTADHGQAFNEHGLYDEHMGLYEEIVKVPLIIRLPGVIPQKKSIPALVTTLDIVPTALDILNKQSQAFFDGTSLLPLIEGKSDTAHAIIFAEAYMQKASMVREKKWKLIVYNTDMASKHKHYLDSISENPWYFSKEHDTVELFNLESDPLELKDLSIDEEKIVKTLEKISTGWYGESSKKSAGENPETSLYLRMKMLGY